MIRTVELPHWIKSPLLLKMFALPFSNLDRLDRLLKPKPLPAFAQGGQVSPDQPLQKRPGLFPQPQPYGQLWRQQGKNPFLNIAGQKP